MPGRSWNAFSLRSRSLWALASPGPAPVIWLQGGFVPKWSCVRLTDVLSAGELRSQTLPHPPPPHAFGLQPLNDQTTITNCTVSLLRMPLMMLVLLWGEAGPRLVGPRGFFPRFLLRHCSRRCRGRGGHAVLRMEPRAPAWKAGTGLPSEAHVHLGKLRLLYFSWGDLFSPNLIDL